MKYLFLDIDGVLNHVLWFTSLAYRNNQNNWKVSMFDPACVKRVNKILRETGAKLVVSSSWRDMTDLPEIFARVGLPTEFDITPHCDVIFDLDPIQDIFKDEEDVRYWRGSEIKWWLDHNSTEDYTYCILDDDCDMLEEQLEYFVNTSNPFGLTDELTKKAINILNHGYPIKTNKG